MINSRKPRRHTGDHTTASRPPQHSPPRPRKRHTLTAVLRHCRSASFIIPLFAIPIGIDLAAVAGLVELDLFHGSLLGVAVALVLALYRLTRLLAPWSHGPGQRPSEQSIPLPRKGNVDPNLIGMHQFERHCAPLVRPFLAELAAKGQSPLQLFVTCADSRVVPNLITTSGPGDLFTVRNIGNLVPRYDESGTAADEVRDAYTDTSVGAAIEYAVESLEVSTIVVCGHSDCGAVKAALRGGMRPDSQLSAWLKHMEPSLIRFHVGPILDPDGQELPTVERLCVANVVQQLDNLLTFPAVREAVNAGRLALVGTYFDLAAARVYQVDPLSGRLSPVSSPAAT